MSKERNHLVFEMREQIKQICAAHGAGNVRVFGSVARGEATADSDVDLLVDIVGPTTQWWPGGLIVDLEAILNTEVDIATEKSLNAYMREEVLKEVVTL